MKSESTMCYVFLSVLAVKLTTMISHFLFRYIKIFNGSKINNSRSSRSGP